MGRRTCGDHSGIGVSFVAKFGSAVGTLEPPEGVHWRRQQPLERSRPHTCHGEPSRPPTSVEGAELAVEHPQDAAVPRGIVGTHGSLEVLAPYCRTSGAHLEGHQLVHAWNTREVKPHAAAGADAWRAGGGAYHPPLAASAGGSRGPDTSPRCPETTASVTPRRCTGPAMTGPEPGRPEQLPAENNYLGGGAGGGEAGGEGGQ